MFCFILFFRLQGFTKADAFYICNFQILNNHTTGFLSLLVIARHCVAQHVMSSSEQRLLINIFKKT